MTKDEKRIAAAQERVKKANLALTAVWDAHAVAIRKVYDKYAGPMLAAEKRVREATAELSTAELAAHLIDVGKTIVRIKGVFAAPVLTRPGYVQWCPVTKDNRIHQARSPILYVRLANITVTGRRLVDDACK